MIEPFAVIGVIVVLAFLIVSGSKSRKKTYRRGPTPSAVVPAAVSEKTYGTLDRQLMALSEAGLSKKKPINKSAYQLLVMIEKSIKETAPRCRVLAEVGMGAFMGTRYGEKEAFRSFVAKRVDFLVIDGVGNPAFAVEFQGSGHYLGDSAAGRDAVKKEALRLAGIELVEIHDHASDEERKVLIMGALERNCSAMAQRKATGGSTAG